MEELSDEQKQLIQSSQISQTTLNSNIKSEDTEFDGYSETFSTHTRSDAHIKSEELDADHIESPFLQPNRFCYIFY